MCQLTLLAASIGVLVSKKQLNTLMRVVVTRIFFSVCRQAPQKKSTKIVNDGAKYIAHAHIAHATDIAVAGYSDKHSET